MIGMSEAQFVAGAAASLTTVIHSITPDQLGARTPCAEFDVRGLVNHLLFWGPSLVGAARKESVPPPAESEALVDLTRGDWRGAVDAHLQKLVAAWGEPAAWVGDTFAGGPMEFPAVRIGGMVAIDLVVHGWDLARATGQELVVAEDIAEYVYDEVAKGAELGREMGVYGPEVAVPAGASTVDRIVGLTGRDPAWSP